MSSPKVLAITKRTAELCAGQSLLSMAGFDLVTATSLSAALSLMKTIDVKGVIVCKHSWTENERDSITDAIAVQCPEAVVIMRCLGCTTCDGGGDRAGTVSDTAAMTKLISTIQSAKP
jgi:hypothetical protein